MSGDGVFEVVWVKSIVWVICCVLLRGAFVDSVVNCLGIDLIEFYDYTPWL